MAEWHFFAMSHGKGPYDGIGGTIKREAAYYSPKQPYSGQIVTPEQLFNFVESNLKGIVPFFVPKSEVKTSSKFSEERFLLCKTIKGTRQFHCFCPVDGEKNLKVKRTSYSDEYKLVKVFS